MIIEKLKTNGFRNLKNFHIQFSKKKNLIYGLNGAGKTSVLEAIFLLSFGKSFLNVKKTDILNNKYNQFTIHLNVSKKNSNKNNIAALYNKNKLSLFLNDKRSNVFLINRYLYPVIFSSSNYNIYIESKTYTRKMIDRFVFGIDPIYIHYLLGYNRALRQKNYILKTKQNIDEISSWNKIMSEMSEKIIGIKMKFIDRFNKEIKNKFNSGLRIIYNPSFNINRENISKDFFLGQMQKKMQMEILCRRSLIGPHLDNFEMHLNTKHLKFYSSGERKINLLMIYISFIELFKRIKNEYPVFLVDDFDAAIDDKNINFLIENYPDLQVIATSVNKNKGFDQLIELIKEN